MGLIDNNSMSFRAGFYEQKRKAEKKLGRELSREEFESQYLEIGGAVD